MNQRLTPSERQLLPYLMTGLDAKSIGRIVNLSWVTVRNHKLAIEEKLGVRGTAQLCMVALMCGQVDHGQLRAVWQTHAPNILEAIECNVQPPRS